MHVKMNELRMLDVDYFWNSFTEHASTARLSSSESLGSFNLWSTSVDFHSQILGTGTHI
jgi:hypothetical protein